MEQELYPEERPLNAKPLDSFTFSTAALDHSADDIELQLEAVEIKINRLVDKFPITIDGRPFPVIQKIIELCQDEQELLGVAKALERVAGYVPLLDTLKRQRDVIEYAKSNPSWCAWAFGDFDKEIDAIEAEVSSILNETNLED